MLPRLLNGSRRLFLWRQVVLAEARLAEARKRAELCRSGDAEAKLARIECELADHMRTWWVNQRGHWLEEGER